MFENPPLAQLLLGMRDEIIALREEDKVTKALGLPLRRKNAEVFRLSGCGVLPALGGCNTWFLSGCVLKTVKQSSCWEHTM